MFLSVSDDELLYQIRRDRKDALELLNKKYQIFIYKWVKIYSLPKDEEEFLIYKTVVEFNNIYKKYDENKGLFYGFIKQSLERFINYQARKYYSHLNDVVFINEEDIFRETYLVLGENDPEPYILDSLPKLEHFDDLERKIINYRTQKLTYKQIAELLKITDKKVEYTLRKYRLSLRKTS